KNAAAEAGADFADFAYRAARFRFWRRDRGELGRFGRGAFGFVHGFVGEGVGFAILFAVDVVDAERFQRGGHFSRALEKGLQLGASNLVLAAHLFDEELGIAFDAQRLNALRLHVVERGDQAVVFGDVVGHAADVFFQLGDDFTFWVANHHAVSGRAGIAARAAVDIGTISGGRGFCFRRSVGEEACGAGRDHALSHQEVNAEAAVPESASRLWGATGSRE